MRALVVIPTQNSVASIEDTLLRARAELPDADVLVIDDASTDGTAERAHKLGLELGRVDVLRRPAASRLAPAVVAGMRIALAKGYDLVVEMDPTRSWRLRSHAAESLRAVDLAAVARRGRWWRLALARRLRRRS